MPGAPASEEMLQQDFRGETFPRWHDSVSIGYAHKAEDRVVLLWSFLGAGSKCTFVP